MKTKNYFLSASLIIFTVVSTYFVASSTAQQPSNAVAAADNEYQIAAILYQQKAAEYRALAYQAYNLARMILDNDFERRNLKTLSRIESKKPRAIVVDIDETVLDNSPAQAYNAKNSLGFELNGWYQWGEMRKAKPVPGAVDFLMYAKSKGVKVFYVSNRDEVQKKATIDNLNNAGLPDAADDTVLLRQTESSKEARRNSISEKYRIVILMGDNLDDLSNTFERKTVSDRFTEVDKMREKFGSKFIVLPNVMYGTWENAIYEYKGLSDAEKREKRGNALELP